MDLSRHIVRGAIDSWSVAIRTVSSSDRRWSFNPASLLASPGGPWRLFRKPYRSIQRVIVGVWALRRPVATLLVSCASLLAISVLTVMVNPALDGPGSITPLLRLTSLAAAALLGGPIAWCLAPATVRRELVPLGYLIAGCACFGLYLSERPASWLVLPGMAGVALGATVVGAARRLMVATRAMARTARLRIGLCAATAGAAAGILGTLAIIALRYASLMETLAVDCVLLALAGTIASLFPPATRT